MKSPDLGLLSPTEYVDRVEHEYNNDFHTKYAKATMLGKVLNYSSTLTEADFHALNVRRIMLGDGFYKVLLFDASFDSPEGIDIGHRGREYSYYVLAQVLEAVLAPNCVSYSGEVGGRYAVLVCLLNQENTQILERVNQGLHAHIERVVELCSQYNVCVEYSYSMFHKGIPAISRAYQEARDIWHFDRFVAQPLYDRQFLVSDIPLYQQTELDHFRDLAQAAYAAICEADGSDIESVISRITDDAVYCGRHSVGEILHRTRLVMYFIAICLENDPVLSREKERLTVLNGLDDVSSETDLHAYISSILNDLQKARCNTRDATILEVSQQTKAWINDHLTDADLSVTRVAEEFDINPNTLTSRFRKYYGISVADYIHTQRVEQAVELLRTTNLTLSAISQRCGYGSVNTLYRAVEKYTGRPLAAFRN